MKTKEVMSIAIEPMAKKRLVELAEYSSKRIGRTVTLSELIRFAVERVYRLSDREALATGDDTDW